LLIEVKHLVSVDHIEWSLLNRSRRHGQVSVTVELLTSVVLRYSSYCWFLSYQQDGWWFHSGGVA